jgi:multicomponent K+:H+ antiporter subunit D
LSHLVVAPIVLPLVAAAICALLATRAPRVAATVSLAATLALLGIAIALALRAHGGAVEPYLLGNWPAAFGIALALDRLAALMLLLTALVALLSLLYALGGDDRRGAHFHALFQCQLMGLNGAFLTADLFNLFVFFEVLLSASYGLMLHGKDVHPSADGYVDRSPEGMRAGSGAARRSAHAPYRERLKATVHYVVFNLAGSALFLVAVSLLYGLTGTLNMASLAMRLAELPSDSAALAQAAALMLLVVFAVKAALLPLYFWLPDAYASATAPVAALFAIMTKVGVYAIARTTTLMFGASFGGATALVFASVLPALALATLALAAVGVLAARRLRGLIAYLVVASAGTLLLALGLATRESVAAALFYLVNSTLVAAAWFLVADRVAAARSSGDALLQPAALAQRTWAPLGVAFFVAAVAVAGMPPLAGFFGKALVLQAAGTTPWAVWTVALVLGSSLAIVVALARAGSSLFWKPGAAAPSAVASHHPLHTVSIVLGLALVVAAAVGSRPVSAFTQGAAAQLFEPRAYVQAVLGAPSVPPAYDVRREMRARGEVK